MTRDPTTDETVAHAADLLGRPLRPVGTPFPGSRRTLVVRAVDDARVTVIAKRYLDDGEALETYAREASALEALTTAASATAPPGDAVGVTRPLVPTLLAESSDPPLLVLSDLGDGPHLASRLLGHDPEDAAGSLLAWAEAVAALHVAGRDRRDAFLGGVATRSGGTVEPDYLPRQLAEAAVEWRRLGAALGVDVDPAALDALTQVPSRFRVDAASVSAADMCPDNNLFTRDGLALLDFEWALWRPVAWDVAYLLVPWPTCWCAWSLDGAAAAAALARWRSVAATAWPAVATTDFEHDLALATEAWAWVAGSWCLAQLVDGELPRPNPVKPMPAMPDRTLRFLRTAARGEALPGLAPVARVLAEAVVSTYAAGDVPPAPAFAGGFR